MDNFDNYPSIYNNKIRPINYKKYIAINKIDFFIFITYKDKKYYQ